MTSSIYTLDNQDTLISLGANFIQVRPVAPFVHSIKNRVCTGYRKETDLLFKNETPALVQRTRRRQFQGDHDAVTFQVARVSPPHFSQPSRRAVINDEAVVHYLGLYNDKVIAASGPLQAGYDYITVVIQGDLRRGGPVAEMAMACGLASIGNSTGSGELLRTARVKQLNVIQQLSRQLQDKDLALSDSSITTCILLATYELITADNPVPNGPYMTHLFGAVKLLALRGQSQMQSDLGYSIWLKLRNMILIDCLRLCQPLPPAISQYLAIDALAQQDYNPDFFMIVDKLCTLRADLKALNHVSPSLFHVAQQLHADFEARCEWVRLYVSQTRPQAESLAYEDNAETTYRFFSRAAAWLFIQCIRVIFSDIFLSYARSQHTHSPSPHTLAALDRETLNHERKCTTVQDAVSYFLDHFAKNSTATRIHGALYMLWPLGLFLSLEESSPDRLRWIVCQGRKISDKFSLRMGNVLAEAAEGELRGLGVVEGEGE
ncbi:hypothetical protein DM02DRAFT_658362 [Periconia macrospinosa]|uniref:Transcription factor domain-containing protein n=1 Tax=Periconia macrospinosa TaxID=97972 RepID=A0A2V1DH70_9PLEO|nr:hypothetical protein DM02DRAFT_658362 [Periconia macrospinosa]